MKQFIKALYADLLKRIDVVTDDINTLQHHEDIRDRFIAVTISEFKAIGQKLRLAQQNGELEYDAFYKNNIVRFNGANREFNALHSYRYLPIKNYALPEIFFFRVVKKIYLEHRILAQPPIVSTISNFDAYYWAVPHLEIIALPAGEEHSLLNLPDLYHEIGHLIHVMNLGKSYDEVKKQLEDHFNRCLYKNLADQKLLERANNLWAKNWLEEFTCDLLGCYMCGPAYAWTNLKLLATGHGTAKVYRDSASHPADEARMQCILLLLEKMGLTRELESLKRAWAQFLKDTHAHKPSSYGVVYPPKLLAEMVSEFYEFYQNADLASFAELQGKSESTIADLLNKAWEEARNNPENYQAFERNEIAILKQVLGFQGLVP